MTPEDARVLRRGDRVRRVGVKRGSSKDTIGTVLHVYDHVVVAGEDVAEPVIVYADWPGQGVGAAPPRELERVE